MQDLLTIILGGLVVYVLGVPLVNTIHDLKRMEEEHRDKDK